MVPRRVQPRRWSSNSMRDCDAWRPSSKETGHRRGAVAGGGRRRRAWRRFGGIPQRTDATGRGHRHGCGGFSRQTGWLNLVITGEGCLDGQTLFGKAPAGVAKGAKQLGLPVIAICGCLGAGAAKAAEAGIDACFSAPRGSDAGTELAQSRRGMLERALSRWGRVLALGRASIAPPLERRTDRTRSAAWPRNEPGPRKVGP